MAWSLGTVRIFTQEIGGTNKQIVPRLQPLAGGTVYQVFGYEKNIKKVDALVVGESDLSTIKSYTTTGNFYTLNSPEGSLGNFIVSSVQYKRINCIYQTIRLDLPCNAPVYEVSIELYRG